MGRVGLGVGWVGIGLVLGQGRGPAPRTLMDWVSTCVLKVVMVSRRGVVPSGAVTLNSWVSIVSSTAR